MRTTVRAKPFVKWVGGKQALAATLAHLFPQGFERFYEPFLGGGSILFSVNPKLAVVCDLNDWLVDTYLAIRDNWKKVALELDALPNTPDDYLRIRALDPRELGQFRRAAHFIYLNKTCFRGLFRVNQQGRFNVPYGNYQRAYYDPNNLENVANFLQQVEFRTGDFETTLFDVAKNDFVYFDPPYYKLGGYADFNRYTKGQFRETDHHRLAGLCRDLDNLGVKWALSNSDTAFVREIFDGFRFHNIESRREINLKSQSRSMTELLITNYAPRRVQRSLFE
jgi:DNA adenine methylase